MKFTLAGIAAMGMLATALSALPPSAAAQDDRSRDQRQANQDQRTQDQRQYNQDQRSQEQRQYNNEQRQSNMHPDYSNNKYYTLGNREGYQDYQRKKQRDSHNHKFKHDEDRSAHDYGYQQGWQGQRGYKSDDGDRR